MRGSVPIVPAGLLEGFLHLPPFEADGVLGEVLVAVVHHKDGGEQEVQGEVGNECPQREDEQVGGQNDENGVEQKEDVLWLDDLRGVSFLIHVAVVCRLQFLEALVGVEFLQPLLLLQPPVLQPLLQLPLVLRDICIAKLPDMEVNLPRINPIPGVQFCLGQDIGIRDGQVIHGIKSSVPHGVDGIAETCGAWVEAILDTRELVFVGKGVAPLSGFRGEVSTLREEEELDGILQGIEVVQLLLELEFVGLPFSADEEEAAHLHAIA